jgi:formylmethanofuran dehydrogenase subunit B
MKKMRIYADTSVFGGCFDEEFQVESQKLFDAVRSGTFILVVSDAVLAELQGAPQKVREIVSGLDPARVEFVAITTEMENLRDAYLKAGVVGPDSREDAEHIAIAVVSGVDLVASWNFKHIVHYDKIAGYNAVNLLNGYRPLQIFSPKEIVEP